MGEWYGFRISWENLPLSVLGKREITCSVYKNKIIRRKK
jgi:hypothetical protein